MSVQLEIAESVAEIILDDPSKRNALDHAVFDALDDAIGRAAARDDVRAVILRGEGKVFCAGFDLAAAAENESLMGDFIVRLSRTVRAIRRMPQPVIAAVQGAAIAGGCAMISACDFVFVERNAKLGYPVHQIGVSPAVTLPTLMQAIGAGGARALVMSDALISGAEAYRIGLATHVVDDGEVLNAAREHARMLAAKPPQALRITKQWLNELDGSLDDSRFEGPAESSAEAAQGDEAQALLRAAWRKRGTGSRR